MLACAQKLGFSSAMRVAVTGTTGRVGAALARGFARDHEVVALPRREFDLADPKAMAVRLESLDCEVFLNPAGLTSLEACEDEPELAGQLNAHAPALLTEWAARRGVMLVHFSTDYVFSGDDPELRSESDATEPLSIYGSTKLAGEKAVLSDPANLVLRVSWVFGPEKPSFLDTVIRDALAGKPISAVGDKFSLPTHTRDLCDWVGTLIERGMSGLFHACQSGPPVSWHGMACEVVDELLAQGRLPEAPELLATRLSETTAFRAKRPRHSAMSTDRLVEALGYRPEDWRSTVRRYVSESR